jgi:hypothetical protein
MKGISREVVPYTVERLLDAQGMDVAVVSDERAGLSLYLDPAAIDINDLDKIKDTLGRAMTALERMQTKPA